MFTVATRLLVLPCLSVLAACNAGAARDGLPVAQPVLLPVALPSELHGHRMEHIEGGLLVFGGFGDPSAPDRGARRTWWLAPGAQAWERRADMGTPRAFFGSCVVAGTVYAIGEGLERYDFAADRWSTLLGPEELPRSHFAAAASGSTLFVLGGYGGPGGRFLALDLPRDGADAAPSVRELLPPPGFEADDHFHLMHVLGGELHVIGGYDGDDFEPLARHAVLREGAWVALAPPPAGIWAKFAIHARAGDVLDLFGDFGAFRYDAPAQSWSQLAPFEGLLAMPQAVVLDEELWVVGGMAVGREHEAVLLHYDRAQDTWEAAPPAQRPAGGAGQ